MPVMVFCAAPQPVSDSLIHGGPQSLPQRIGIKCHGIQLIVLAALSAVAVPNSGSAAKKLLKPVLATRSTMPTTP